MSKVPSATDSQEMRILDSRGCLTLEAMCFSDQLQPDQRAVVERHASSCMVCAQQQTELARVTERLKAARPRVSVPSEISLMTRQAILSSQRSRGIARDPGKRRMHSRLRAIPPPQRRIPWYYSRIFWAATLIGMTAALIVALVALILLWR